MQRGEASALIAPGPCVGCGLLWSLLGHFRSSGLNPTPFPSPPPFMSVAVEDGAMKAVDPEQLEATQMVDALKRKLVQCANELHSTQERLSLTNATLEVEKREHQLTTRKLSSLLRKRSASAQEEPASTDLALLHQQICVLQQQLRCSQESEGQLREQLSTSSLQYEKLRLLTLEGFRSQRAESSAAPAADENTPAQPLLAATDPTHAETPQTPGPPAAAAPATPRRQSAPAAAMAAVRVALQPQVRISSDVLCAQLWRRPSEHAQPRVGLPRSKSDLVGDQQPINGNSTEHGNGTDGTASALASGNQRLQRSLSEIPSSLSLATDASSPPAGAFGYARGASICVDPPKRQRNHTTTSVMQSPRLG